MIVLKFGGLYADLDSAPTMPVDDILHAAGFRHVMHNTVLCVEDEKTEEQMATSARCVV
jgi:mannosyltransferase OCH1-like enzyme